MKKKRFADLWTKDGEKLRDSNGVFIPWNVYPRPQLVRDSFFCLNGEWDFSSDTVKNEKILVPFAPESLLSGVHCSMGKKPNLKYSRSFELPIGFIDERVILHFGAVDQIAEVILNGQVIGEHCGGYLPFSFDVTDIIKPDGEQNILEVNVLDELYTAILPYGKQCEKRGGMWYTPVSGIWQTVWIESVPYEYVRELRISCDGNTAEIFVDGVSEGEISVITPEGERSFILENGFAVITIEEPRMWSPEDPYLYRFTITSGRDFVRSYFALRTLEIKDVNGTPRLCLNGEPYFFHGLLDQGYFSDGIFTPATPDMYEYDISEMKKLGFNMLRKHIKIEPEQFYYDCDRLGMVVFQDMVNNGSYSFVRDTALPTVGMKKFPDNLLHRNKKTRAAFEDEMIKTVKALSNHPSICYWTIFNEGWGQFSGAEMYKKLKQIDPTRFIDTASGWFRVAESDVESIHVYFKPVKMVETDKPLVLSEFGGYSYKPYGHVFSLGKNYGYRFFDKQDEFEEALYKLYEDEVIPLRDAGLCASVYTQVSDVEDETNGLMSYDRLVLKVDPEKMKKIADKLRFKKQL